jgi:hypothetical protein
MGIDFAPQQPDLAAWQEEIANPLDRSVFAESDKEDRLPSGWWVLPFAAAGLIECYLAIPWIFAHL